MSGWPILQKSVKRSGFFFGIHEWTNFRILCNFHPAIEKSGIISVFLKSGIISVFLNVV